MLFPVVVPDDYNQCVTRRLVYVQCMDGEYFRGSACPNDGWTSPLWDKVSKFDGAAFDDVVAAAGLRSGDLAHIMVVEQHDDAAIRDVLFVAER